ncbi:MAG TPA: NAD-dependent epimerase/dehydratase family protein [Anaerolineae bacterium]|nr:NAD-dependent epimerase/dehydratase family protein [Anaerolineae bacterium]
MRILITGGAGFIGSNAAHRFLQRGAQVTIFDNLSRRGSISNLDWLHAQHGADSFRLIHADVHDADRLAEAARGQDVILHYAGQVAVTTSVQNPRGDFEDNALGTFNALEAARLSGSNPIFMYSSTNKVYGGMEYLGLVETESRYAYRDHPYGISEDFPLDFHSPYGCSKGTGDQYVRDYARIYGLRTVVFRQSAIYGPRQFGIEDQGWIAWFIIAAVTGQPITIYGDGKQVRDVLYVDDLIDAYESAIAKIDRTAGQVFNIGGGADNTLTIWTETGPLLEQLLGRPVPIGRSDWRPGDQRICVMDIRKAQAALGWSPKISVANGVAKLYHWVVDNRRLFEA